MPGSPLFYFMMMFGKKHYTIADEQWRWEERRAMRQTQKQELQKKLTWLPSDPDSEKMQMRVMKNKKNIIAYRESVLNKKIPDYA